MGEGHQALLIWLGRMAQGEEGFNILSEKGTRWGILQKQDTSLQVGDHGTKCSYAHKFPTPQKLHIKQLVSSPD